MKRTVILLINLFVVAYSEAQQWFVECPHHDNEDVVFLAGDMSGNYNYTLGYRYDKTSDILYPQALCFDQEGNYISREFDCEGKEGAFNSAVGLGNNNIFVTAYCTDNKCSDVYEKMWISVLDPNLNVMYENYINVEEPYVSYGYTADIVVNEDNEFVVLVKVAENVTGGIMHNCDFVFYKFDAQCNLLSSSYLENTSYDSEVSDFVYLQDSNIYAVFGKAMNVSGVNSIFYVDENFTLISCNSIDNPDNYPNYIRPYFISVGKMDDNSILMSMQTRSTVSKAEYCPLVLRVDRDMNILDSIKFERYDVTDYVSQYNSIVYVNPNVIYVSSFEVKDMFGTAPNTALVYLIDERLNMLGRKTFELGFFMNILYIQPTVDGGCIVQAYYEREFDKVSVICKLSVDDFRDDVGVDEYKTEFGVESYPNPVSSILNIHVEDFKDKKIRVMICDISGRRYLEKYVYIDDKILTLDLSSLKQGSYCYNITDDSNNVITKTFIKY